jgi:hypothetical protein
VAVLGTAGLSFGQGGATPIVGAAVRDVDYHAEGQIIGGNVQIQSDRAPAKGVAAGACDPDPRPAPHPRPDACAWAEPAGAATGRDLVSFGRHIADADASPNAAFSPGGPSGRESFNGKAGFDGAAGAFRFTGDFYDDEDMRHRLTPRTLDAYLAPGGDAGNRWRRFCGTGIVEPLGGGAPAAPFAAGQVRKFVAEVWDADWRAPSDRDGGNQDYWVIDVLAPGSTFDVSRCQSPAAGPGDPAGPAGPAPNPRPDNPRVRTPGATTGSLPPLAVGSSRAPSLTLAGRAGLRSRRACVRRGFTARVAGRGIRHVTFAVNGRRVARVTRARGGAFSARVAPWGRRTVQRVTARVVFRASTGTRARTLRLTFRRCAAVRAPAFTG